MGLFTGYDELFALSYNLPSLGDIIAVGAVAITVFTIGLLLISSWIYGILGIIALFQRRIKAALIHFAKVPVALAVLIALWTLGGPYVLAGFWLAMAIAGIYYSVAKRLMYRKLQRKYPEAFAA